VPVEFIFVQVVKLFEFLTHLVSGAMTPTLPPVFALQQIDDITFCPAGIIIIFHNKKLCIGLKLLINDTSGETGNIALHYIPAICRKLVILVKKV